MKKKLLITLSVVACALLLVVGSIAGTIAYLTSQSEVVKNTFTVGKISITLDEADTDNSSDADRDILNTYHLLPGEEYAKDPTVHVAANSEDAWLFVEVVNSLAAIEDASKTIDAQIKAKGWTTVISSSESTAANGVKTVTTVYAYKDVVAKDAAVQDKVVFEKVAIANDIDNATLDAHIGANVTVTAYAVQASDDFAGDAVAAWNATFGA